MKKCIEITVEGRRQVVKRRTWLDSGSGYGGAGDRHRRCP